MNGPTARLVLALLISLGCMIETRASDPPLCYRMKRLADLDSVLRRAVACSLNDAGEVTGLISSDIEPFARPFVWSPRGGTKILPIPPGLTRGFAYDINNQGVVCGSFWSQKTGHVGFLWSTRNRIAAPLTLLPGIKPSALSNRMEGGGIIVGGTRTEGIPELVVWIAGNLTTVKFSGMDFTPGTNEINDINSDGVVVGTLTREDDFKATPFRWTAQGDGQSLALSADPLPTPPDYFLGRAYGINDRGDIVGSMADLFDDSVASWQAPDLEFVDLGQAGPFELVSRALAINNKRFLVGYSPNDHPLGLDTPWLYAEGQFHDMNRLVHDIPPGVEIYRAWDINNEAQALVHLVSHGAPTAFDWAILEPDFGGGCSGGTKP